MHSAWFPAILVSLLSSMGDAGIASEAAAPYLAAARPDGAPPVGPSDQAEPGIRFDAPTVALAGVPIELTIRAPESGSGVAYRLLSARGTELAAGELAPGSEIELEEFSLAERADLPLRLEYGTPGVALRSSLTIEPLWLPGWVSLLPPLVAIALAIMLREVVASLFLGVWLGAFLFAGLNPLAAIWRSIDRFIVPALADPDHVSILVFSLMLGGMVGVMSRSGGTQGIVRALGPLSTTPRRAQVATWLAGLAIFFDDYANTLLVGNTFRPITDRVRVSREKLAYIVDSTAAPVAAIVFVSTWVGFEISLIGDALRIASEQPGLSPEVAADLAGASPFTVFLHSVPYLFYPILAIVMVGLLVATQRDFGPMLPAEQRARRGEGLYREGAQLLVDSAEETTTAKDGVPGRWYNAAGPVLTVVLVVVLGLYFDGRAQTSSPSLWDIFGAADPFKALLWGSLAGCLVAFGLSIGQRILSAEEAINAWLGGIRSLVLAAVILTLAWSLGEVTAALGTATYLTGLLSDSLLPALLPALVFVAAAMIAFATGTSWATMAILFPLVVPLSVSLGGGVGFEGGGHYTLTLGAISSVLAGSIFGDHCSPISDTTVMSSLASGCDHVDHVRTQLPYALVVGLTGLLLGDLATAFGLPLYLSYPLAIATLVAIIRLVGRASEAPAN
jgi:Na+/H+ antiporter NhaC